MTRPIAAYTDIDQCDPTDGIRLLETAGFDVRVIASDDRNVIAEQAHDATALLIGYTRVDQDLLSALPSLQLVATQSVGTDMVDLEAAASHGIWVSNVPDAAVEEVATHAFAMALALVRGLPFLDRDVRSGRWDGTGENLRRSSETTLGIVGLGRIGQHLAHLARPVFGTIIGCDPVTATDDWPVGVVRMGLDTLMGSADVVSLHLPLTERTHHLLGADRLRSMRDGASIVNVARGGLIDQDALLELLDAGHLTGAALDVLADEPPTSDDPVRTHPRVLLSPHAAYMSEPSKRDYVVRQAQNVAEWYTTGRPVSTVVAPEYA